MKILYRHCECSEATPFLMGGWSRLLQFFGVMSLASVVSDSALACIERDSFQSRKDDPLKLYLKVI